MENPSKQSREELLAKWKESKDKKQGNSINKNNILKPIDFRESLRNYNDSKIQSKAKNSKKEKEEIYNKAVKKEREELIDENENKLRPELKKKLYEDNQLKKNSLYENENKNTKFDQKDIEKTIKIESKTNENEKIQVSNEIYQKDLKNEIIEKEKILEISSEEKIESKENTLIFDDKIEKNYISNISDQEKKEKKLIESEENLEIQINKPSSSYKKKSRLTNELKSLNENTKTNRSSSLRKKEKKSKNTMTSFSSKNLGNSSLPNILDDNLLKEEEKLITSLDLNNTSVRKSSGKKLKNELKSLEKQNELEKSETGSFFTLSAKRQTKDQQANGLIVVTPVRSSKRLQNKNSKQISSIKKLAEQNKILYEENDEIKPNFDQRTNEILNIINTPNKTNNNIPEEEDLKMTVNDVLNASIKGNYIVVELQPASSKKLGVTKVITPYKIFTKEDSIQAMNDLKSFNVHDLGYVPFNPELCQKIKEKTLL